MCGYQSRATFFKPKRLQVDSMRREIIAMLLTLSVVMVPAATLFFPSSSLGVGGPASYISPSQVSSLVGLPSYALPDASPHPSVAILYDDDLINGTSGYAHTFIVGFVRSFHLRYTLYNFTSSSPSLAGLRDGDILLVFANSNTYWGPLRTYLLTTNHHHLVLIYRARFGLTSPTWLTGLNITSPYFGESPANSTVNWTWGPLAGWYASYGQNHLYKFENVNATAILQSTTGGTPFLAEKMVRNWTAYTFAYATWGIADIWAPLYYLILRQGYVMPAIFTGVEIDDLGLTTFTNYTMNTVIGQRLRDNFTVLPQWWAYVTESHDWSATRQGIYENITATGTDVLFHTDTHPLNFAQLSLSTQMLEFANMSAWRMTHPIPFQGMVYPGLDVGETQLIGQYDIPTYTVSSEDNLTIDSNGVRFTPVVGLPAVSGENYSKFVGDTVANGSQLTHDAVGPSLIFLTHIDNWRLGYEETNELIALIRQLEATMGVIPARYRYLAAQEGALTPSVTGYEGIDFDRTNNSVRFNQSATPGNAVFISTSPSSVLKNSLGKIEDAVMQRRGPYYYYYLSPHHGGTVSPGPNMRFTLDGPAIARNSTASGASEVTEVRVDMEWNGAVWLNLTNTAPSFLYTVWIDGARSQTAWSDASGVLRLVLHISGETDISIGSASAPMLAGGFLNLAIGLFVAAAVVVTVLLVRRLRRRKAPPPELPIGPPPS